MPHTLKKLPDPRSLPHSAAAYARVKPALDFGLALLLLVASLPVLLLAALAVKLTSPGPVIYTQTRVGRDGRTFRIYKVRTMHHDCEAVSGVRWCSANDNRVTRVGRVLRKTHVDELPQLWNVLRGEMSLVGPRPERPEFVVKFAVAIPGYRDRLLVPPGIAGLAQVRQAADVDMESVRRKLAFDLAYVRGRSLWLDVRILAGTAAHLVGMPFSVIGRLFALPGPAGDGDTVRADSGTVVDLAAETVHDFAPQPFDSRRRGADLAKAGAAAR